MDFSCLLCPCARDLVLCSMLAFIPLGKKCPFPPFCILNLCFLSFPSSLFSATEVQNECKCITILAYSVYIWAGWCVLVSSCIWMINMQNVNNQYFCFSCLVSVWAAAQTVPLPSSEASPAQPSQRSLPHSESSQDPRLQTLWPAGHDAPSSRTQTCGQSLSHPASQSSQVGETHNTNIA